MISILTLFLLIYSSSQSAEAASFASRCSAPGVVMCNGFDNTTKDIVRNVNLFPGDGGFWGGSLDTVKKASGTGSLQFFLPGNRGTSDISGSWNASLGASFGPNTDFYVQLQIMITPEMISNLKKWRTGVDTAWKSVLFHRTGSTCGQIEITTVVYPYDNSGTPEMYTGCGTPGFTAATPGLFNANGNLIQQGTSLTSGYNCSWQNIFSGNGNGNGCFIYPPNKWITFYYKIHLGDMNGGANSNVEAFIATDGGPYQQFVNVKNLPLQNDGTNLNKYDSITLTPYMTGLKTPAGVDAYIWYDELIVSTNPILPPDGSSGVPATSPTAPKNLRVQ